MGCGMEGMVVVDSNNYLQEKHHALILLIFHIDDSDRIIRQLIGAERITWIILSKVKDSVVLQDVNLDRKKER
jgi:hypothetical protein